MDSKFESSYSQYQLALIFFLLGTKSRLGNLLISHLPKLHSLIGYRLLHGELGILVAQYST
ncbi:hypothetical protein SAMN04515620_12465 [Collimonas sp. OK607]|nr:hypothetical protein SAMN04515620_12465 [Collimonas sp. OK607]